MSKIIENKEVYLKVLIEMINSSTTKYMENKYIEELNISTESYGISTGRH